MAPLRPQQYRISWPLTPKGVEDIDTMFETLFKALRSASLAASGIPSVSTGGGVPGPIGPSGDIGEDGADGVPGVRGATGATGATGLQGYTIQGNDGDDGQDAPVIPGPQGPKGDTGSSGSGAGIMGPPGQDGADGEDTGSVGLVNTPGILLATRFPALTGDVTTPGGSLVTTAGGNCALLNQSNTFTTGQTVQGAAGLTVAPTSSTSQAFVLFAPAGSGVNSFMGSDNSVGGIFGAGAYGMAIYGGALGGILFRAQNAAGTIRFMTGGGNLRVQINANGTQTWAPYGAGAATFDASGNITSVSDERVKDRIAPLPYGLTEVLALHPVQHGYNELSGLEQEHLYGGFLAQDVLSVMPLAVGQNADGYYSLADRPIIGALVNAVKELTERIKQLESKQESCQIE